MWNSRSAAGRAFQTDGAATLKTRRARSVLVWGTIICGATDDRSAHAGARVCTNRRGTSALLWTAPCGQSAPSCMWPAALLEASAVTYKQRTSVSASSTLADDLRQIILNTLKFVEYRLRCAAQKDVAVVESGGDYIGYTGRDCPPCTKLWTSWIFFTTARRPSQMLSTFIRPSQVYDTERSPLCSLHGHVTSSNLTFTNAILRTSVQQLTRFQRTEIDALVSRR